METDEQKKVQAGETAEGKAGEEAGEKKEKPAAAPSAEARGELAKLKEKIENEKKEKIKRQEFLKSECTKKRTPEGWITNKPDAGVMAGMAKDVIGNTVDEKFAKYQSQFEANGIGDAGNVTAIKQAVKDIVYDYYIKNGNDQGKTTDYAENRLEPKINFLFNDLKRIFDAKIFPFEKPADCLGRFSEFTGLNFFTNGTLNADGLKSLLLLEKTDYDFFLKSYEQYLIIGAELDKLKTQEDDLAKGTPEGKPAGEPSGTKEPDKKTTPEPAAKTPEGAAQQPPEGTPPSAPGSPSAALPEGQFLNNKTRILVAAAALETEETIRKAVYEQLPPGMDAKARDKTADRLVIEAKKLDAQAGETIEIDTDGTCRKVDLAAEEAAKQAQENPTPSATPSPAPSTETDPNPAIPPSQESTGEKTGIEKFFDKISKFFEKIMGFFNGILVKMGLAEAEEFANLQDNEKKEAVELKNAMTKAGLNLETLHPLFTDAEQTKKILKERQDKGISWEDYLTKYLTPAEGDELKKKQDLKADQLAQMLTSPSAPAATPGTPQVTPGTQPPPAPSA
jgi:hypothetical protein